MSENDRLELEMGELAEETALAYLLKYGNDEFWIPKSQSGDVNCVVRQGKVFIGLSLPEWVVFKKGMDGYVKE